MTIEEFGHHLRAREITSEQTVEACLERVTADNPRLNAFIQLMADEARRQARTADQELRAGRDRGPLHGVPLSIKDLIDVRGTRTTAASRVRESHAADRDAPAIVHLRQAGAVLVGKTNLHEFALGTTNEESAFGPARNPRDPSRSPGGSSGGSAASVAAGMVLASIGTDTGGSIRIPAAACGLVGLKPSYGEVSTEGVVPLSHSLDHVGPLAATVADATIVYRALLGGSAVKTIPPGPIASLRIGVLRGFFCDLLDDDVRSAFESGVDRLRVAGATVEDVDIRHAADVAAIYVHIVLPEAAAYHARTLDSCADRYTEGVRLRLEMGRYILAEDYARATFGRDVLRREIDRLLISRDVLMLPTLPIPAPRLGAESVQIGTTHQPVRNAMLRLTQIFNLTGHPVVAMPSGETRDGLPCSTQLVGTSMRTEALLRAAVACEPYIAGTPSPRSGREGG